MPNGVTIAIASETREYAAGIQKGVIEPSQDAADALDRLGRNNAGEELERDMRTAQRGTDELRSDIASLSREVRSGGQAGRQYGSDMRAGMHEADEGVKAAKENTASNLKEVAASFDGTVSGAVSGVQGLAAEVLEGFGPGGLLAGAIAAGAIGLITTGIEDADEKSEQLRADVAQLAQAMIDAGTDGADGFKQVSDALTGFATQSDKGKVSLADIKQQADQLGVPFARLARAYAEGGDGLDNVLRKTDDLIAAQQRQVAGGLEAAGQNAALVRLTDGRTRSLEDQRKKIVQLQTTTRDAQKAEQAWLEAGGEELQAKADATEDYAGNVQSALHDAGASWDEYKDKEGGLSLDRYIKVTQQKVKAVEDYETNVAAVAAAGNQNALNYVESLGTDAAPLLEKFVNAPAAKKKELIDIWSRLGAAATGSFNAAIQDGIPDVVPAPALGPVDPDAYVRSVQEAQQRAQRYLRDHPLRAGAVAYDTRGKPIYQ